MNTLCKDACKICVKTYFERELSKKELSFFLRNNSFDIDWEKNLVLCPCASEESASTISIKSEIPTNCRYSMEQFLYRQSL